MLVWIREEGIAGQSEEEAIEKGGPGERSGAAEEGFGATEQYEEHAVLDDREWWVTAPGKRERKE